MARQGTSHVGSHVVMLAKTTLYFAFNAPSRAKFRGKKELNGLVYRFEINVRCEVFLFFFLLYVYNKNMTSVSSGKELRRP